MQLTTKRALSFLIACSIALTPSLRSDGVSVQALGIEATRPLASAPEPLPEDPDDAFATTPQETPVTPAPISPPFETPEEDKSSSTSTDEESQEEEGTTVSQGSDSQRRASKRKQLRNIGIAVLAVAVAVVAMILVSTNDGHKSH